MAQLIDDLRRNFPPYYVVEVNVLDGLKNSFQAFRGTLDNLTLEHMRKVLRQPGCFYSFNVVGVDEAYLSEMELHCSDMLCRDFVWITEPAAPKAIVIDKLLVKIGWQPVTYCGVDPASSSPVNYILEMAEGGQYVRGVISDKFAVDTKSDIEFKPVIQGPNVLSVELNDLRPVTWYHFRLIIEFQGSSIYSEKLSLVSSENVPESPPTPRCYVKDFPGHLSKDRLCKITWTPPQMNGSKLIKYHVQARDIPINVNVGGGSDFRSSPSRSAKRNLDKAETSPATKTRMNSAWKLLLQSSSPGTTDDSSPVPVGDGDTSQSQIQLDKSIDESSFLLTKDVTALTVLEEDKDDSQSVWKTVYFNKVAHTSIVISPLAQEVLVRVRVKSNMGWSKFSNILSINARSHPSLFPRVFSTGGSTTKGKGVGAAAVALLSSSLPMSHQITTLVSSASFASFLHGGESLMSLSPSPLSRGRSEAMIRAVTRGVSAPLSKLTPLPDGRRQLRIMSPERANTVVAGGGGLAPNSPRLEPLFLAARRRTSADAGAGALIMEGQSPSRSGSRQGGRGGRSAGSPNHSNESAGASSRTTTMLPFENDLFYDECDDMSDTLSLELPTAHDKLWDIFYHAAWEDCSCPLCAEKKLQYCS